jgi:hypothetical protein
LVVTAGTWAFITGVFGHYLDFVFPDPALLSVTEFFFRK